MRFWYIGWIMIRDYPFKVGPVLLLIIGFGIAYERARGYVPYILSYVAAHASDFNNLTDTSQLALTIPY